MSTRAPDRLGTDRTSTDRMSSGRTSAPPHPASFCAALGTEVRARRSMLGLNQSDVADLAGVSERFVRFVEQGKTTVQLEPLLAVLGTLGLELSVRPAQAPAHTQAPAPTQAAGPNPVPGIQPAHDGAHHRP